MATQDAPSIVTTTSTTTADLSYLTTEVKQVAIENYHATQILYVKPKFGATAAAALAAATADAAVAAADDCFVIPAGKRKVIAKSTRGVFCAISHIASGAATTFTMEGTAFRD